MKNATKKELAKAAAAAGARLRSTDPEKLAFEIGRLEKSIAMQELLLRTDKVILKHIQKKLREISCSSCSGECGICEAQNTNSHE